MIWNVARMGGIQLDWTILYLEISDVSDVLGETMSSHTNFFCSDSTPRVTRVATRVAPEHVLRARAETSRTYIPSSWPCIQEAAAGRKDSRISPFLSKDSKRLKSWLRNASKCYIFTWLDVNWMLKVEDMLEALRCCPFLTDLGFKLCAAQDVADRRKAWPKVHVNPVCFQLIIPYCLQYEHRQTCQTL